MSKEFTCLIPAHNEAARIGDVLRAVIGHPELDRVLVIDDGSQDHTAEIARAAGAEVIRLAQNRGKSAALAKGLSLIETTHVLLIDADLQGLRDVDVSALIRPVVVGEAKVSISLRGNAPLLWRMIGVDYISGERALPMSMLYGCEKKIAGLPRFGFEVFLNNRILGREVPLSIVAWPTVSSPMKRQKTGWIAGTLGDAKMIGDILRTVGLWQIVQQIVGLRRLADVSILPPVKAPLAKLKSAVQRGIARG